MGLASKKVNEHSVVLASGQNYLQPAIKTAIYTVLQYGNFKLC